MRVISGEKRGRKLVAPEGLDTRPTSDMVKEAFFNIVQFETVSARFLDLFSGSGQMSIEAVSRGAQKAVAVDFTRKAVECIKQNIKTVGYEDKIQVVMSDAVHFVSTCNEKFDIIFADPPYNSELVNEIIEKLSHCLENGGTLAFEVPCRLDIPDTVNDLCLHRYRYGKTELAVYRQNRNTEIF